MLLNLFTGLPVMLLCLVMEAVFVSVMTAAVMDVLKSHRASLKKDD